MKEVFKIGDIIEIKSWDEMLKEYGLGILGNINCYGGFSTRMKNLCGRKAKIKSFKNLGRVLTLEWLDDIVGDTNFIITTDMVKKVVETPKSNTTSEAKADNEVIIITNNGHSTVATYYNNNVPVSSKAMCHPEDSFDFGYGAILALERLFPESKKNMDIAIKSENKELEEADTKLPARYLAKDNVYFCEIGLDAGIKDVFHQKLFTGDVVECYDSDYDKTTRVPIIKTKDCFKVAGLSDFIRFNNGVSGQGRFIIKRLLSCDYAVNGTIVDGYVYVVKE